MSYLFLGVIALAICILIAPALILLKSFGFVENLPWTVAFAPLWMPLVILGVVALFGILCIVATIFFIAIVLFLSTLV